MAKQSIKSSAGTSNENQAAYIFADALKAHSDDDAKAFALKIAAEFDARVQFEISRASNGSADMPKVKKLNGYRAKLALPSLAKVMMELGKGPEFINTRLGKEDSGDRFNIYAIDKAIDFVRALFTSGAALKPRFEFLRHSDPV
ncbi:MULTISPECIES: hypothetical protein [Rhizobium/Agrobacterium group]|uniref:hypothetical protein n=1 Tax=Rhizobium/Agrobacterium group TaxID=227290 RepID=UPI000B400F79|nr:MULTISPECIES: hypothetical protein [Rhizobium/Agrobacterium group]MCF1436772.1 hypothetical protein [Allorhizobium ampelinum]MCF1464930.1 hypothetical protein [Allorhizobium ampelinum]MCF1495963.1 hypothetical protein [Allorhizobium ampelinum]MUO92143.1 hypothetical protein [Agrobacterium vitis]MUZ55461.1 hypothetical protein [Agrobacterium vitis]